MVPFPVESLLLWYHFFVLMMSSDIHKNHGPMVDPNKKYNSGFLSYGNWNLNTLSKDDFHRISLLEANNTLFNYDIISNGYIYIMDVIILLGKSREVLEYPINRPFPSR